MTAAEWAHVQIELISLRLNLARGCIRMYSSVGISRSETSLQISGRMSCCFSAGRAFQSEKLSAFRPRFTSLTTNQEAGASLLYQGQTVWLEWQSLQARQC